MEDLSNEEELWRNARLAGIVDDFERLKNEIDEILLVVLFF